MKLVKKGMQALKDTWSMQQSARTRPGVGRDGGEGILDGAIHKHLMTHPGQLLDDLHVEPHALSLPHTDCISQFTRWGGCLPLVFGNQAQAGPPVKCHWHAVALCMYQKTCEIVGSLTAILFRTFRSSQIAHACQSPGTCATHCRSMCLSGKS